MANPADPMIDALRTQHDQLAALVARLDPEDVTRGSAATEWTIADVLSHLGSGAEITAASLEVALTGSDSRGEGFNQSVWDRWNAKSPQDQAADFVVADEALVSRYESIDAATRDALSFDLGFLPQPLDLAGAVGMRLNEVTLHAWDVLVVFDPASTLPTAAADLLIDRAGLLFGFLGHADALDGVRGSVAVRTSEPDRAFGVEIGEKIALTDEPAQPGAVVHAPAEAWLRLTAGRLAPEYTPASVTVTGDLLSLQDLRRAFPGY